MSTGGRSFQSAGCVQNSGIEPLICEQLKKIKEVEIDNRTTCALAQGLKLSMQFTVRNY